MGLLSGKTLFITGASRGIGKAIGLRAALDGANVVVAAKTTEAHAKLPGTIYSAAAEINAAGGRALALAVDVRDEEQIRAAIQNAVATFGGIDILVNNASAIAMTGTLATASKRFDLMHQINVRGAFLCSQIAIPHLTRSTNPHVLTIAPPLDPAHWFTQHVPYALSKFGMTLSALGMAREFSAEGIAFNTLWPRTTIDTPAMAAFAGEAAARRSRRPEIMADAAYHIVTRASRAFTGNCFVDETVLRAAGVTDFSRYRHDGVREDELVVEYFGGPIPERAAH